MKKLVLICSFCFVAPQMSIAEVAWFKGSVVCHDRTVLTGDIAIFPAFDVLLLRDSITTITLTANKISAVYYYDTNFNINRRFISISTAEGKRQARLYEVVFNGKVKALRKIRSHRADINDDRYSYDYFVWADNRLVTFTGFEKQLYSNWRATYSNLHTIVAKRKLSPSEPADIIPIIKLFVDLQESHELTASQVF